MDSFWQSLKKIKMNINVFDGKNINVIFPRLKENSLVFLFVPYLKCIEKNMMEKLWCFLTWHWVTTYNSNIWFIHISSLNSNTLVINKKNNNGEFYHVAVKLILWSGPHLIVVWVFGPHRIIYQLLDIKLISYTFNLCKDYFK